MSRKSRFRLERHWRVGGVGETVFNVSGTYPMPHGKSEMYAEGKGGDGSAESGGNYANTNPPVFDYYNTITHPGNVAGYNTITTPGNFAYQPPYYALTYFPPVPGNVAGNNPSTGGNPQFNPSGDPLYNPVVPGNPYYNPNVPAYWAPELKPGYNYYNPTTYNPGPANYNPITYSQGNANYNPGSANYNPYHAAVPGQPTYAGNIEFPAHATPGSPAPFVPATLIDRYAQDPNYPVTVPIGGYVIIKSK